MAITKMKGPVAILAVAVSAVITLSACGSGSGKQATGGATGGSGGGQSTVTLKVASYGGTTYPIRVFLEKVMADATAQSNGRIKFKYYPNESLVKLADGLTATASDTVDIAMGSTSYDPDTWGILAAVANLPYNFSISGFGKVYRDPGQFFDWSQPQFNKNGLELLSWPCVSGTVIDSRKSIASLADMKGKLIRAVSSVYPALKAMGAKPVNVATADLYTALQRGTVDGALITADSVISGHLEEVAPYILNGTDFYTGALPIVMNLDKFNKLPEDLRQTLTSVVVRDEAAYYSTIQSYADASIKKLSSEKGVHVTNLNPSQLPQWKQAARSSEAPLAQKFGSQWTEFTKLQSVINAAGSSS